MKKNDAFDKLTDYLEKNRLDIDSNEFELLYDAFKHNDSYTVSLAMTYWTLHFIGHDFIEHSLRPTQVTPAEEHEVVEDVVAVIYGLKDLPSLQTRKCSVIGHVERLGIRTEELCHGDVNLSVSEMGGWIKYHGLTITGISLITTP